MRETCQKRLERGAAVVVIGGLSALSWFALIELIILMRSLL